MPTFDKLNTNEIKDCLILLDIDGTIAKDDQLEVSDENLAVINRLKQNNQIYLCSNSRNHKRNKAIADNVGLTYLDTDIRKPSKKILDLIDNSIDSYTTNEYSDRRQIKLKIGKQGFEIFDSCGGIALETLYRELRSVSSSFVQFSYG